MSPALPTELLITIFHAACDDDGATARSLASACRSFYWLALPLIYHTVALHNATRLDQLLDHFEHEPSHACLVEHILVAGPDNLAPLRLRTLWNLIAPNIKSLAFVIDGQPTDVDASFQTMFDAVFPRLTDLTLCGDHPVPSGPDSRYPFPALKRFHTAGMSRRNPAGCFAPLTAGCPGLEHIRLSMVSQSNITLAVAAALGLPDAPTDTERMCLDRVPLFGHEENENGRGEIQTYIPFPSLPRGLVSLVVKPAAPPVPLFAGATSMFYGQYMKQLEDLVPVCPKGKVCLLPAFRRAMWEVDGYGLTEMKRDWLEAMRGGMGAWSDHLSVSAP